VKRFLIAVLAGLLLFSLDIHPALAAVRCSAAPLSPVIETHYPEAGTDEDLSVNLTIDQPEKGDRADIIYYAESLYDENTKSWTPWSNWNSVNQGQDGVGITDQLYSVPGKSREEIEAYSSNSCGKSPVVMSTPNGIGFPLNIVVPRISNIYKGNGLKIVLGRSGITIANVVSVSESVELKARSLTPLICSIGNNRQMIFSESPGNCQIEFSTIQNQNVLKSDPYLLTVPIYGLECIKGKKLLTIMKKAPAFHTTQCPVGYKETARNQGSGA